MSEVLKEHRDGITEITFYTEKANSLNSQTLQELIATINAAGADDNCRVVVLKSRGKTFCAGACFEEMKSIKDLATAERFFSLFGLLTVEIRKLSQPIIISVQGKAVGGGVGIIAAGDIAVGTVDAAVRLSEFEVGIAPFAISPILEWKIGGARLLDLSLSASWRDSDWCLRSGLLSERVQDDFELNSRITDLTNQISKFPKNVVSNFKQLVGISVEELEKNVLIRAKNSAKALISAPK